MGPSIYCCEYLALLPYRDLHRFTQEISPRDQAPEAGVWTARWAGLGEGACGRRLGAPGGPADGACPCSVDTTWLGLGREPELPLG